MSEENTQLLHELRVFALSVPVIIPLIEKRKKIAFEKLMQRHKEGITDYIALVAELNVLNDLEREIRNKAQTYQAMENKNG